MKRIVPRQEANGSLRRAEMVAFIASYSEAHGGNSPALQEIADALHIGKTTVHFHLTRLIKEGRAVRSDGKFWLVRTERRRAKHF